MILGAHVSIAGGISNAPDFGKEATCCSIQIFSKNQMQWKTPPLSEDEVSSFMRKVSKYSILPASIHASYLVNIASFDNCIFENSISNLANELERAEILGIEYVVVHPGAHKEKGEEKGLKKIIEGINAIFGSSKSKKTMLLLETTAHEGTVLGYKFEHLSYILEKSKYSDRLGVCFDTCHVFASGYDIASFEGFEIVLDEFDKLIGLEKLKVFHLNDSKFGLGERKDRHEEIGKGKIGLECFSFIVNDGRFKNIPGILEVPGNVEGYKRNLRTLRRLKNGDHKREC